MYISVSARARVCIPEPQWDGCVRVCVCVSDTEMCARVHVDVCVCVCVCVCARERERKKGFAVWLKYADLNESVMVKCC